MMGEMSVILKGVIITLLVIGSFIPYIGLVISIYLRRRILKMMDDKQRNGK